MWLAWQLKPFILTELKLNCYCFSLWCNHAFMLNSQFVHHWLCFVCRCFCLLQFFLFSLFWHDLFVQNCQYIEWLCGHLPSQTNLFFQHLTTKSGSRLHFHNKTSRELFSLNWFCHCDHFVNFAKDNIQLFCTDSCLSRCFLWQIIILLILFISTTLFYQPFTMNVAVTLGFLLRKCISFFALHTCATCFQFCNFSLHSTIYCFHFWFICSVLFCLLNFPPSVFLFYFNYFIYLTVHYTV